MVETPEYKIVKKAGNVEIRQYPALVLATARMKGGSDNEAFGIVAGYIFGNNALNERIAMTAPVITARQKEVFTMSFVMPSGYDIKSLPKPASDIIKLEKRSSARFATIRFSGRVTESNVKKYTKELLDALRRMKLRPKGEVLLMRYNPPWTLPFFRRNELAVQLA